MLWKKSKSTTFGKSHNVSKVKYYFIRKLKF
jgi:hypothetical protein